MSNENKNICPRSEPLITARMFAAVYGLGGEVSDSGLTPQQIQALQRSGSGSKSAILRYMLALDVRYATDHGMELHKGLMSAAREILNPNLKGGEKIMSEKLNGDPNPIRQERTPNKGAQSPQVRPLSDRMKIYLEMAKMYPPATWDPSKEKGASVSPGKK